MAVLLVLGHLVSLLGGHVVFPQLSYAHSSPTHNFLLMICVSTGLGCSCLQTPSARLRVNAIESGYTRLIIRIIRLEDFLEECGEGVVMSIINVKYTIRMLNMFHLRAESPLRDVWIKRYNLNVCSQETAPVIKCTKL